MAKNNIKTETLIFQLRSLCSSNGDYSNKMDLIEQEYHDINRITNSKAYGNKQLLYKLFHANRFIDSSLRLFLEIHGCLSNQRSIGQYLEALTRSDTSAIFPMSEQLKNRFKDDIANVRNRFIHSSGQYPNCKEYNEIMDKIHECLQCVLKQSNI